MTPVAAVSDRRLDRGTGTPWRVRAILVDQGSTLQLVSLGIAWTTNELKSGGEQALWPGGELGPGVGRGAGT